MLTQLRFLAVVAALLLAVVPDALAADAGDLQKAVVAACGCLVTSVRVFDPTNSATWSVQYDPSATSAQQAAGNAVISTFNMNATPITSMQIASTSTPSLNGIYAIDPASQQKVQAISLYIAVNGKFPAGQSAQAWPDASGAVHLFPSTAEWQAFATAMGDFVATLDLGQTPAQPVTIP
jgi:hypothetical protein